MILAFLQTALVCLDYSRNKKAVRIKVGKRECLKRASQLGSIFLFLGIVNQINAKVYLFILFPATSCSARRVEILPNSNPATDDGTEIVGVVSSGSCDKSTTVLQISHTKELSNAVEIEVTESDETNWAVRGIIGSNH